MKKTNQHMTMIIIGTAIAVAVMLLGWIGSSVWNRAVVEKREAILIAKIEGEVRAEKDMLNKVFEDVLNTLLINVKGDADAYKKDRKVLREIIRPENMMQPEFVEENYVMMQQLVPSMRGKMDKIMLEFERADEKIKVALSEVTEETATGYLNEWKEIKDVHLQSYISFFGFEEQIITAYAKALNFYQQHGTAFRYDAESNRLLSDDVALMTQEAELRATIKTLSQEQAASLTQAPEPEADPDAAIQEPAPEFAQ